ncbi:MAG: VOC family protein [Pseudomonadota bacterium]
MITGLDHFVLICPDIEAGVAAYETIMGRAADWRSVNDDDGTETALFRVGNTALELMAPAGGRPGRDGPVGKRLRDILDSTGPGLASIAFATADIDQTHRALGRRGLAPSDITAGSSADTPTGQAMNWRRFRCDDQATAGIRTFVIADRSVGLPTQAPAPGDVANLDHIVINTPNPDRAAALYGARLGLRLALDRTAPEWNTRFLFFRTGGLTFEVVSRLDDTTAPTGEDTFYGLTWATDDIGAAHERLARAGLNVSEVRTGRKPGSEVFTLRDGHLGVPTLFIAHAAR